jgi:hypothetical protein
LDRPSWAPVALSGALPRELSDVLAIVILGIASLQLVLTGPLPFSSLNVSWVLLLLVPLVCILAALSNSPNREREELALVAYGGSLKQIELRYILRGAMVTIVGLFPVMFRLFLDNLSFSTSLLILALLVLLGGSTYAIPALKRTRSASFVEHYKG